MLDCLHTSSIGFSLLSMQQRMIYRASRYDLFSSLLKELHWLRVPERIEFKLCALVYKCLNGNGPAYLTDSLQRVTDIQSRRRLRSSSSSTLIVPVTRRATLGDRAFPVVAARAWNGLPDYVTSASTYASFCTALKMYLFSRTFWHWQHSSYWLCNVVLKCCCACTTLILSYDDDDDDDKLHTDNAHSTVYNYPNITSNYTIYQCTVPLKLYSQPCQCHQHLSDFWYFF